MTVDELLANLNATINEIEENEQKINEKQKEQKDELNKLKKNTSTDDQRSYVSNTGDDSYYPGYERANTKMEEVAPEEMGEYFLLHGGKKIDTTTYEININGQTYRYNTSNQGLYVNENNKWKSYIGCSFYKTPGTKLGQIDKTITLLPGSGEQHYGAVNKNNQKDFKHTLPKDTNVNDGCLVIVPFRRDENLTDDDKKNNVNMYRHPDRVFSTVLLGNSFANGSTNESKHVKNSIVGYSFGAIASFTLAAEAPKDYFDTLVAVDLGSYAQKRNYDTGKYYEEEQLTPEQYQKIKNMEFIFMSTKGNDHWQDQSMANTYNTLKSLNANATFYTNLKDRIVDPNYYNGKYYVSDTIYVDWPYNQHKNGYQLIDESNILSYLSR